MVNTAKFRSYFSRKIALWLLPGLFVFGSFAPLLKAGTHSVTNKDVLVKLQAGLTPGFLATLPGVSDYHPVFEDASGADLREIFRINFAGSSGMLSRLMSDERFAWAEFDSRVEAASILTSDPQFTVDATDANKQWWLTKIKLSEAWEVQRGNHSVTVAVIDTGINGKHEDLNDGRVGAGYITYCQTANAATGACLVHVQGPMGSSENSDDNGHGTIVAGIIGAIPNNGRGIAGVNWNVRLMPVKALDSNGSGVASDVAAGIVWAADNGADIINLSLGGTNIEGNAALNAAITHAYELGALVVAAAGNDSALVGSDLDIAPVYPVCDDGATNMVLGVAASDISDKKAAFSNFGRSCIDITAPGTAYFNSKEDQKGLVSTYYDPKQPSKNNLYVYASGTSMSAPIVSGVAALLKSEHADLSGTALRDRLIGSAENIDALNPNNCQGLNCTGRLGSGRINAQKALQTTTFTADSLIRDASGRTYFIDNGLRRLVSTAVFAQRGFSYEKVKVVSTSELELLPAGQPLPPLDGTLMKSKADATVYEFASGVAQPVSYLAFVSHEFTFTSILEVPGDEMLGYRKGPNLVPRNGAILKLSELSAVYFMHEGKRRLISLFTFRNRGLDFGSVVEIAQEEFLRYPEDSSQRLQPPLDGTLLKGSQDSTIYVFEDGLKRPLSAAAFAARGYSFAQVSAVEQSEVDGYSSGPTIY